MPSVDARPLLSAFFADSLPSLSQGAKTAGCGSRWIVADASLGSWRPRHLAQELAAQLNVTLAQTEDPRTDLLITDDAPSLADMIGLGIDAEASGDGATRTAVQDAEALAAAAHAFGKAQMSGALVLAPRTGHAWRVEEARFVQCLARALEAHSIPFRVVVTQFHTELDSDAFRLQIEKARAKPIEPSATISSWTLVPGLLDAELQRRLQAAGEPVQEAFELSGGHWLIPPENRPSTRAVAEHFDKLGDLLAGTWCEAYFQLNGNNLYVDAETLTQAAWQAFSQSSVDLALDLLQRAIDCAHSPNQRAILECQAQGMRIASLRFKQAAQAEPVPTAPQELHAFTLETKAWGMVMTGAAEQAAPLLDQARTLASIQEGSVEHLYLLNITALGKLRQGAWQQAVALEEQIASERQRLQHHDARLTYVNCLNLARLYRRAQHWERAREMYELAFATTLGARSQSDLVYVNATLAMLAQTEGRHVEAAQAWMRAALHWLACDVPEALGRRVTTAIVGREPAVTEDSVELVSRAIIQRWTETGQCPSPATAAVFQRLDRISASPRAVLWDEGYCVAIAESSDVTPTTNRGSAWQELAGLVTGRLLHTLEPRSLEPALPQKARVLISDRQGRDLPTTPHQAIELAVQLDCAKVIYPTGELELSQSTRQALLSKAVVRMGPAVSFVHQQEEDSMVVVFQRYLQPLLVSGLAAHVLRGAEAGTSLETLGTQLKLQQDDVVAVIRELEKQRLVVCSLTEEACTAVGIKLPLNATSLKG